MKKLLLTLAVLSLCVNLALAGSGPHGSGGSHPGGSGPTGGNKPSSNSNKPSQSGKGSPSGKPTSKPTTSKYKPHSGAWRSWDKRQYSKRLGCLLYWSAEDGCWYRYDEATQTFVPCDGLTSENLND